jgi:hypothetical protein
MQAADGNATLPLEARSSGEAREMMMKTGRDLRSLLDSGGRVDIQSTPYERAGFWISIRDRSDRSRGYVSLKTLNRLLCEMARAPQQPKQSKKPQHTVAAEIISLKARVKALEDAPRPHRSQTKRKRARENEPVDQTLNDIALGLTGKAFAKLRPVDQDKVRQLADRVIVS